METFTGVHLVWQDFSQSEVEFTRAKWRDSGDWNAAVAWAVTTGAEPVNQWVIQSVPAQQNLWMCHC